VLIDWQKQHETITKVRSRRKFFFAVGTGAIVLGIFFSWMLDTEFGIGMGGVLEPVSLLLLGLGSIAVLIDTIIISVMLRAIDAIVWGSITFTFSVVVVPFLVSLLHFEVHVHSWTGVLLVPWLLCCLISLILLVVGVVRKISQRQ